jgi:hypothetical protein
VISTSEAEKVTPPLVIVAEQAAADISVAVVEDALAELKFVEAVGVKLAVSELAPASVGVQAQVAVNGEINVVATALQSVVPELVNVTVPGTDAVAVIVSTVSITGGVGFNDIERVELALVMESEAVAVTVNR